ncbi:unnamed protein product [Phaeothamnion confervicola]
MLAGKLRRIDNAPAQILPYLYIGSIGAAFDLPVLQDLGITHIICAGPKLPELFPEHIVYLRVHLADRPGDDLLCHVPATIGFITGAARGGGKTLVHCLQGRSRSAALILAYLVAERDTPLAEALEAVRRARPCIQPNLGFMAQLRGLEKLWLRWTDKTAEGATVAARAVATARAAAAAAGVAAVAGKGGAAVGGNGGGGRGGSSGGSSGGDISDEGNSSSSDSADGACRGSTKSDGYGGGTAATPASISPHVK